MHCNPRNLEDDRGIHDTEPKKEKAGAPLNDEGYLRKEIQDEMSETAEQLNKRQKTQTETQSQSETQTDDPRGL